MATTLPRAQSLGNLTFLFLLATAQLACSGFGTSEDFHSESAADAALRGQLSSFVLPDSTDFAAIPQDPTNRLTEAKVELGRLLFHDPTLLTLAFVDSGRASASCATCHHARAGFQSGMQQAIGDGGVGFGAHRTARTDYPDSALDVQPLRTPSAMNAAWFDNVLWNGQFGAVGTNEGTSALWEEGTPKETNHLGFHGLEIQAIAGQDVHRLSVDAAGVASIPTYAALFDEAFSDRPREERIDQVTAGLAIAAFERTVLANQAPFQAWLRGDHRAMTSRQVEGARLFFGAAGCAACHDTPGLGGMTYHALGMADMPPQFPGVDPEAADHRGRGGFTGQEADDYAFKTPQLYNLRDSPFLGHGGTFRSVREVIEYKNRGTSQNAAVSSDQLSPLFVPLGLSAAEVDALTDFVENALYDPNLLRYEPTQEEMPKGSCVPNDDPSSRASLGCTGQPAAWPSRLDGLHLVNAASENQRWAFPAGVVLAEGGVAVIARDASREDFEAHWGPLPPGALFLSAGAYSGSAPIINGGERFTLEDATGAGLDEPCPSMVEGMSMHRGVGGDYQALSAEHATPGRVNPDLRGHGLVISEITDSTGVGAYRFEYVEIAYVP